jgi:uncharacterized protein YukE
VNFYGMTVDDVTAQAELTASAEQRLEELVSELEGTIGRSESFWRGPDADSFRSRWALTSSEIRSTGQELAARSTELEQHRDEQETASAGDGSGAGSDGAPGGGTGSEGPSAAEDPVEKTNGPGEDPYYGEVDPEVADRWEAMEDEEREKVAQAILDAEFERYGIEPAPEIIFDPMHGLNGKWSAVGEDGHKIEIDGTKLKDPEMMGTIAHEARHAAQWEAVKATEGDSTFWDWLPGTQSDYERLEKDYGMTPDEVDSWWDHWTSPEEEQAEYYDQSVEVDARNAGAQFNDGITPEDLDRYQEAAGVSP